MGALKAAELFASIQELKRKELHSGAHVSVWWSGVCPFHMPSLELFFGHVNNAQGIQHTHWG